jgi:mono/diheme cytochrome c family protein
MAPARDTRVKCRALAAGSAILLAMRRLILLAIAACSSARADQPSEGVAILAKHCGKCHAGAKAEGDLGFVTDTQRLITEGYLVPGDARRSQLVQRIVDGEMPPAGVKLRPSAQEIAALTSWIDGMPTTTGFRGWREIDRLLAADAAKVPFGAEPRWFSLVHLANAGATDAQLDRYRTALATLLASLTWSAKAPPVVTIDRERTLFRIDLRDLGWSGATWDAIRASYPYGVARGRVPEAIRADWFVATASRAPLYHALLGMPDTEAELARRLGIDLAENVARDRVWRSGFNRSGVSVNNRVIERHATRHGALWRSYDFASSVGRENVFTHPLDFVPAGGEIIFNLPNGFQAYLLVDKDGKRIDRAPTSIVSDPRRPDRAVENAVSCIGCHASGIVPRVDQVRGVAASLEREDRDRVRALHPEPERMAVYFEQDRARFATALASINAKPTEPADEPVTALVTRYENELDVKTAAAELGLRADELTQRLSRLYALKQTLGSLAQGGTIKRDTWSVVFPRVVGALGVGVPFTPLSSRDPLPPVWVDDHRRTWIVVDAASDQATAIGSCRGRGYELPREAELVSAVANGLSSGLAVVASRSMWAAGTKLDAANLRYGSVVDPRTGTPRRADITERHAVVCVQR